MTAAVSFAMAVCVSLKRARSLGVIVRPMSDGQSGVTVEAPSGKHRDAARRLIKTLEHAHPDYRDAFVEEARAVVDGAATGGDAA